uniref:Uncharacterized protein n=1 Tax=Callithrix jacchus TaxID=9483 RepID=A0A8I3WSE6_CALJA
MIFSIENSGREIQLLPLQLHSISQRSLQCFCIQESHSLTQAGVLGNPCLIGSTDSHASASRVAGTTGVHHYTWLLFLYFLVETGFHYVAQAGLELLSSGNLPTSVSQTA